MRHGILAHGLVLAGLWERSPFSVSATTFLDTTLFIKISFLIPKCDARMYDVQY
jgi:hypothetical protein